MKNTPIGIKLIGGFLALLLVVCFGLGFIAYDRAYRAVLTQVLDNIPEMAKDGARLIQGQMNYHRTAIESIAVRNHIWYMDWMLQIQTMNREVDRLGYLQMGVATPDGSSRLNAGDHPGQINIADQDYFQQAMAGDTVISDVFIHQGLDAPVLIVATPIRDGDGQGNILGVLFAVLDAFTLSQITDEIRYGPEGFSFIIDSRGTTIAHPNPQFVHEQHNVVEASRTNPILITLAEIMNRMIQGQEGTAEYKFDEIERFVGFAPVQGTSWALAVGAVKDDVFAQVYHLRRTIGFTSLFFFVVGIGIALLVSRAITGPINRLMRYAQAVADGDLQARSGIEQRDEIGRLNQSIQVMVQALSAKMAEADAQAREAEQKAHECNIATEQAEQATQKAEQAKRDGMLHAAVSIEAVVERMTSASEELAAQVEEASRGADEQKGRTGETATAMEEMNATVLEVAKNASHAAEGSDKARAKAQEGSRIVTEAVTAINQVESQTQTLKGNLSQLGRQAEQIGKIMTVIEDIADQTNLLALNAAIEAARAGDAGRGFAVVADEVRKLAEKTMSATKEVGDAIAAIQEGTRSNIRGMEQAVVAVGEATKLANSSGEALREIVSLVEEASDQVRSIATAAEEQSASSEEINRSVEDINRISSETSEIMGQSALAVSELARQSVELRELVNNLKNT